MRKFNRSNTLRSLFSVLGRARLSGLASALVAGVCAAQPIPIYPDDSVQAREALARVVELDSAGNSAEAVRVLQSLLENEGDKVLESANDADLFLSVRQRVHETLLSRPALLERYRLTEGPVASRLLEEGRFAEVEASRLLTASGLRATLLVATRQFENAQFEGARLTLMQLDRHPDRASATQRETIARVAELAGRLSAFLDRPSVREWAQGWAQAAGIVAEASEGVRWPESFSIRAVSPLRTEAGPEWGSLPSSPLVSVAFGLDARDATEDEELDLDAFRTSAGDERAWILPSVVGDVALINDGSEIAALDRYTLAPVWRWRPLSGGVRDPLRAASRLGRVEDAGWVVTEGRVALAATGYLTESGREGDRRLHALEIATGRNLWSVDPGLLDRRLEGGSVRGPVSVSEGVVVVPVRRVSAVRRISGTLLAGLDLWSGELRWVRPLASMGVQPFSRSPRGAERQSLHEGVIYRVDSMGVAAAVHAASGRVAWVRRLPPATETRGLVTLAMQAWSPAWSLAEPLLDGDSLIAIAPDSGSIVRLSLASGEVLARRSITDMGDFAGLPQYLLRAGDRLIVAGTDRLASMALSGFESAEVSVSAELREPRMTGRVLAAQGRLIVPLENAVAELDAVTLATQKTHEMTVSGVVLPLADSALVMGPRELHALVGFEVADAILTERMTRQPDDPAPALSLLNLSARAERFGRLVPAADHVLEIRSRVSDQALIDPSRRRLLESLRAILVAGRERFDRRSDAGSKAAPIAVLQQLAQRFARAADSIPELAEHALHQGWLGEASGSPAASLEAYTRVLSDDSLANALVPAEAGHMRRAGETARERLLAVVRRSGPEVYRPFALQAERDLADLGERPGAGELEALASRFPASPAAARALTMLGEEREKAGAKGDAVRLYARALTALDHAAPALRQGEPDARAALGERVLSLLIGADRVSEAFGLAHRMANATPGAGTSADVAARAARQSRRPNFGSEVRGEVQVLSGWSVASPKIVEAPGRPTDRVVMVSPGRRQIALFATSLEDGTLRPLWIRPIERRSPRVIRVDHDATYLYWPGDARADRTGGSLERVHNDGASAWLSKDLQAMLESVAPAAADESTPFSTPMDGSVSPGDLLVTMNDDTMVLLERSGRMLALDLSNGQMRWGHRLSNQRIYDGVIVGATLVVGGASTEPVPASRRAAMLPLTLQSVDLRRGGAWRDLRSALPAADKGEADPVNALGDRQQVRWLRRANDQRVLVGMHDRVVCVDLANASTAWSFESAVVTRSAECWIVGDRAYVLGEDQRVTALSLREGVPPHAELETPERMPFEGPVEVGATPTGVLFVSSFGLVGFSRDGSLEALDAAASTRESASRFALGHDRVAMISEDLTSDGHADLRVYAASGGRLLSVRRISLARPPTDLHALDQSLLLTAGPVTFVLPMPIEERAP